MHSTNRRILVVADWDLDPTAVISELSARLDGEEASVGLLVPARLHGLDWAGDPRSSQPCAERQLRALERMSREQGLRVDAAWVGDPETVPATAEALDRWPAAEVLLFDHRRRFRLSHPFAPAQRIARAAKLAVTRIVVSVADQPARVVAGHCQPAAG